MNGSAAAALLAGCGFPARWAGAERCVLLQTQWGNGEGVLAAWHAWRSAARLEGLAARQLVIVSIAAQAPRPDPPHTMLAAHHAAPLADLADLAALAARLCALWPPATPDLHVLDLEPGVRLLLAMGQRPWLRLLRLQADVVLFDALEPPPSATGAAVWDTHALKALGRLAAPHAVWAGQPGGQPPRGAVQAPRHAPLEPRYGAAPIAQSAQLAHMAHMATAHRHAVVIGAGIAGACTAHALAAAGWACTVLDAHGAPAQGASGNAAALFHGTVHPGDGLHARFTRACALRAAQLVQAMVQAGVPGDTGGLLRAHAQAPSAMQGGTPWPARWAQRLDAAGVQQRMPGLRADTAWFFPGGGWVAAADAVRWLLQAPGIGFQGGALVHTLQRSGDGWLLLDAAGHTLAQADTVVLATAGKWPLLRSAQTEHAPPWPALPPAHHSRGQVTWFDSPARLSHPVAGHGYALTGPAGQLLCGASSQTATQPTSRPGDEAGTHEDGQLGTVADDDAAPRDSDHQFNLQRLQALTGIAPPAGAVLHGRVGWRHLTVDRLPLVGAVPSPVQAQAQHIERLRDVTREPNLWLLAGLGGRGFTWAPLLGDVVAALASAGPVPMEASLLNAADPARHWLREARRKAAG